jgi:hypothetical protein
VWITLLITCVDSCRVAIARAGMNLSQAAIVFLVEIGSRFVRTLRTRA